MCQDSQTATAAGEREKPRTYTATCFARENRVFWFGRACLPNWQLDLPKVPSRIQPEQESRHSLGKSSDAAIINVLSKTNSNGAKASAQSSRRFRSYPGIENIENSDFRLRLEWKRWTSWASTEVTVCRPTEIRPDSSLEEKAWLTIDFA